ncbi:putative 7-deoxyloganetin glucosyltransferase [Helianthus annuus]|uniref:Glycosyltransferase n=1 Tax=Helianthus annuus TaxID=4232 RepID=A0A251UTL6_HELAN|nr:7-deoxyloganetin glucosyltransferase [Helianthus annuus]KAF5807613.1 putative 7-deoxyloganetin glucosyltransferase [Helianthus annuus]
MGSNLEKKPHALCIPAPLQGHINPMLKLAKILHSKGFLITFVNTEFNHQRLLRSQGLEALHGLPSFRFETIPDGLPPPENTNATQEIPSLAKSVEETCLGPFKSLVTKVNASYAPVTCIVSDLLMGFTLAAAEELGIPEILLWTSGTGSLICYNQFTNLLEKELMPLKDPSYLVNGYLDTVVDCIPTMPGIRLKDFPPFIRIIYPGDEYMVRFLCLQVERAKRASAIIFNTFDALEHDVLDSLSSMYPPCYGIGPLHLLEKNIADKSLASFKSNLWKEEPECLKWLDSQAPSSVIYVNFGSIAVMTPQQLVEFCWGLAKSNYSFLWIIRPDLVIGDNAMLPPEFVTETSDRGMLVGWCPQEEVLNHPSIGGFLTHSGWNSTLESISSGVPMICWPFFADQQTNCWWSCNKWGVATEIDNNVKSDEVSKLVVELMKGEKGREIRKNVIDLKNKAQEACIAPSGSSMTNLEKVVQLMHTFSK